MAKKKSLQESTAEEIQGRLKMFGTLRGVVLGIFTVYLLVVMYMFVRGQWDLDLLKTFFPVILGIFSVTQISKKMKEYKNELGNR